MTIKFEVGKSYGTRSTCDYDCIYAYVIVRRTAKSVWIKTMEGKVERRTIRKFQMANQNYDISGMPHDLKVEYARELLNEAHGQELADAAILQVKRYVPRRADLTARELAVEALDWHTWGGAPC